MALRAGLSGIRIPPGEGYGLLLQTGSGAHPASRTMATVAYSRG